MRTSTFILPVLLCGFSFAVSAAEVIPSGTRVEIRVNDRIRIDRADGRVYTGVVQNDVTDANGRLVIGRGSRAELLARRLGDNDISIDLDSINVGGRHYTVDASTTVDGDRRDGVGANRRTGKFIGGGAVFGTLLGAIAGGGRGAAIGAASGAAVGAGTETMTRGRRIDIPAESILSFRLDRELVVSDRDNGHDRDGQHYHDRY